MRITDSSLEQIRQRIDIVELVREYLPNLKQTGRNHKACCPFHQEKTPSFMVNADKQIFHCFGCQAGGDIFSFLMKMEGLTFPESVAKLGAKAGIRVVEMERSEEDPSQKERVALRSVLQFAQDFYQDLLKRHPEADTARRYLKKREVDESSILRFRLGYAPRGGSVFVQAALRKGYAWDLLAKAGLATLGKTSGSQRDYFWGRLVYPICDARGEVVGFGARILGDGEPKYLNSPDTVLFSKGKVLYGLYESLPHMRRKRRALLLEGYMDVIAAHQFGVHEALAPLGTALSETQAAILKRHVDEVIILFDPDEAGTSASLRSAQILFQHGLRVHIATLPEGDPDEFLHRFGAQKFQALLAQGKDLVAFQIESALKGRAPASLQDKARLATQVLETVRKCPDEILRSEWIRYLAQRMEIDEQSLYAQLRKEPGNVRRPPPARVAWDAAQDAIPTAERDILLCLFRSPALARDARQIAEKDFSHEKARKIFRIFQNILEQGQENSWTSVLLGSLAPEEASLARSILCDERNLSAPERMALRLVERLRKERRLKELEPLVLRMTGGEISADPDVQQEYQRLLGELKGSQ